MDSDVRLRVAVVGAGPAGMYVTTELVRNAVQVDIFDRLPTPFGLLRYGVAPDHLKMRSLQHTLEPVLDHELVRFAGGVQVGTDVTVTSCATPTTRWCTRSAPRRTSGSASPAKIYPAAFRRRSSSSGTPDTPMRGNSGTGWTRTRWRSSESATWPSTSRGCCSKDPAELAHTDIPPQVQDELARSAVRTVHIIGRRGPVQARFTPRELAELGTLSGVQVSVDPADLELDQPSARELAEGPKRTRAVVDVLREWAGRQPGGDSRLLRLHFWSRPERANGTDHVRSITLRRTRGGPDGDVFDTEQTRELPVQLLVRSVGYLGVGIAGLPVHPLSGILANIHGRVLRDGEVSPGEYVAGWLGRGAVGVLGTNRHDAHETVAALLADSGQLLGRAVRPVDIIQRLRARGHPVIDASGWHRIDRAEQALGRAWNRPRTRISSAEALRSAAQEGSQGQDAVTETS